MSFFKRWGGQSKKGGKDRVETTGASSFTASPHYSDKSAHPQPQTNSLSSSKAPSKHDDERKRAMDATDDDESLHLPSSLGRRKERNLSISRSGRHKYKNKQRTSVLQNEIYNDIQNSATQTSASPAKASPSQATTPGATSAGNTGSAASSGFGSLGRSGACREVDASSRRMATETHVTRQQTAV